MAAELPPSTRHQSRSRSPSPSAIPQSGPTSSSVVVDPYANHSANAATLNSPPESSHRKRSRSRSPSYTRRRSPSPSSAYQDRPKSFGENSFNGAPKGPLPGAVSIYGAASGNRAPRDGDDRGAGGQGGGGAGNGGSGYRYPRRDGDDRAGGAGGGGGAKNNGVCYAWPTGTCRYGDNCFFKHLDESGREVRKDGPPQRPMLPKRNPAAYPAGAPSYRAQHFGGGGGGGGGMSASSGSSYPPSNLCYEFRNEGRCRYGSRCRYSHDTAAGGGSGAAAAAGAGGAGGAPHSQMAAAAPYGGGRREFYGGDRYNAGPAGMPYPPHGPHFSHRRRSRSPRERRSRSRSPRAHRSRSR